MPDDYETIKYPERELTVNFLVKMDDGSIRVFTGYRVQPVDMDEVRALSA